VWCCPKYSAGRDPPFTGAVDRDAVEAGGNAMRRNVVRHLIVDQRHINSH
jgi:hypothetical protein